MIERCNSFLEDRYRKTGAPVRTILEAGGGSFSHFQLPENASLVALDIFPGQLRKNRSTELKIVGDLHALPIREGSLDMVVCFNVVEHLENPEGALEQLIRALRRNGILVLGFPERNSLKGIVTRATPVCFHQWYYRRIVGKQDRGDRHFDAFATPFRRIVSGRLLKDWLGKHSMKILFYESYDGAAAYNLTRGSIRRRVVSWPYYALAWMGYALSFGTWRGHESDVLIVAEKN